MVKRKCELCGKGMELGKAHECKEEDIINYGIEVRRKRLKK